MTRRLILRAESRAFLEAAVVAGLNIVVAGGTQAGKTTVAACRAVLVAPGLAVRVPVGVSATVREQDPGVGAGGERFV